MNQSMLYQGTVAGTVLVQLGTNPALYGVGILNTWTIDTFF